METRARANRRESSRRSLAIPSTLLEDQWIAEFMHTIEAMWRLREDVNSARCSMRDMIRRLDECEASILNLAMERMASLRNIQEADYLKLNIEEIEPLQAPLVVEDTERAAKAAGDGSAKSKEPPHLSGHECVIPRGSFRNNFTIPHAPPYVGSNPYRVRNYYGDTGDAAVPVPPVTQLRSFQERPCCYHQTGVAGKRHEPSENDDEGERSHGDDLPPFPNNVKDSSPMFVNLPNKTDAHNPAPSVQDPLTQQEVDGSGKKPGNEKQMSNNKDSEEKEETTCALDCLYYTLQCCDCAIM